MFVFVRLLAVLVAALALGPAAAGGAPANRSDLAARAANNERLAQRDASHLLGLVVVPPGSHATRPTKYGVYPSDWFAYAWGIWDVDMSLRAAFAFERAHLPRGARITNPSTLYVHGHASAKEMTFTFPAITRRLSARQVFVRVGRLRSGGVRIGMTAGDTWVVVSPAEEVVPRGVRTIEIFKNDALTHRVTDPGKVATIIRWFDALHRPRAGSCGRSGGPIQGAATERISFLDGSGHPLAHAHGYPYGGSRNPCYLLEYSIGGIRVPSLVGSRFLLRVEKLLR